jgi:hypothetical protein
MSHQSDTVPTVPSTPARDGGRVREAVVFGDVFTRPDVLGQRGRALLTSHLAGDRETLGDSAGDRVALLGEAALGDVADPKRRRELRAWFESAVALGWDRHLVEDVPLGDLVPPARLVPDACVGPQQLASPLRSSLKRAGAIRWSVLLATSLADLADRCDPVLGPVAVASLLGACFVRSLVGAATPTTTRRSDDLATILELERRGPHQPVLESLLESAVRTARSSPAPESGAIGDAVRKLLVRSASWALEYERPLLDLLQAIAEDKDRSIFERAELGCGVRASLPELASELGVSSTRVGQRRDRAASQVRDELGASPAPLEWVVRAVRRSLGVAAPWEAVVEEVGRHGLEDPTGSSQAARAASLLLWLAGPYRHDARVPGWLVAPTEDLAGRTKAELVKDGGVRRISELEAWLVRHGLASHLSVKWLNACGGAVVDGDLSVCLSGPLADVLERLLDAHGRGLTPEDCAVLLRAGRRAATEADVERAFHARRFRSAADGTVELAVWPAVPTDKSTPRRQRRSVHIARPAAGSAPLGESRYVPAGHDGEGIQLSLPGVEGLASSEDDEIGTVSVGPAPRALRHPSEADPGEAPVRAWLTVEVDAALMRGESAGVPSLLVRALGLGLGQRRTFASRYGPVTISNDGPAPMRGPLRPLVLGAGADSGEFLALGFGAGGDVVVEVLRTPTGTGETTGGTPAGANHVHPEASPPRHPDRAEVESMTEVEPTEGAT